MSVAAEVLERVAGAPRIRVARFVWRKALATSDLPSTWRHIASNLSDHMDRDGGSCFPSLDTQARETGRSKSTVAEALKGLERRGYLQRERSRGGRHPGRDAPGRATRYTATVPDPTLRNCPETGPLDGGELSDPPVWNCPETGHEDVKARGRKGAHAREATPNPNPQPQPEEQRPPGAASKEEQHHPRSSRPALVDLGSLRDWLSQQRAAGGEPLHPGAVDHAIRREAEILAKPGGPPDDHDPRRFTVAVARDEHPRYLERARVEAGKQARNRALADCSRCNDDGWLKGEDGLEVIPAVRCHHGGGS